MTSVATSKVPGNPGRLLVTAGSTDGVGLPASTKPTIPIQTKVHTLPGPVAKDDERGRVQAVENCSMAVFGEALQPIP